MASEGNIVMNAGTQLMTEDVMRAIGRVLHEMEPSTDPAEQIVKVGTAIAAIGNVLKGRDLQDARRIIRAAATLCDVRLQ